MKPGRRGRWAKPAIALFFLAWAVLFTFPLVLHLGDSVALSAGGDAYLHLWDLWWADKSLVDLRQSPFHTYYLYHPTGVSLYYHSLNLVNGVASIPLQWLFGLTPAFNLLVLANLTLDGLAAYWLCVERTGSAPASLVGGALFASAALMGTSVNLGQLDQLTAWWIPLYLLALWRMLESPGMPWQPGSGRRATLCAGICLAGSALATWYFTAGLALFTVVFVPAYLLGEGRRTKDESRKTDEGRRPEDGRRTTDDGRRTMDEGPRTTDDGRRTKDDGRKPDEPAPSANDQATSPTVVRPSSFVFDRSSFVFRLSSFVLKMGIAVGIMAVLLAPLLVGMIRERLNGETYMIPSFETTYSNSADLAGLFLPARTEIAALNEHGSNVALGWVGLVLAGAGVVGAGRRAWPLLFALLALVVVSLGPQLQVAGIDTRIPLPYDWLNNVPFVGASRQPLRFLAVGSIILSLLAAYGVAYLLDRWRGQAWSRALVPAALVLAVVELFGIPRALVSTLPAPAYGFIRAQTGPGGVMELPYELWQARSDLSATAHEKPILGGYTSRHFPYPFIEGAPGAAQLAVGYPETLSEPDIVVPTIEQTALASLDHYGVRYVILHKSDLESGRFGRLVSLLAELYPEGPVYEDGETLVYLTPTGPAAAGGPDDGLPLVGLGKGWHELEADPLRRWTGSDPGNGNAQVWVGIRPGTEGAYTLDLEAFSYGKPRHLSVLVNGVQVFEKEVGLAPESLAIDLGNLAAGDYLVELNAREQPDNPPNDRRPLSIGYTRVGVERR